MVAVNVERVPAHVRNLQARLARLDGRDIAGDPVQAGDDLVLEAARRHELSANANPEERPTPLANGLVQRLDHAGDTIKAATAVGESAYSRKHDTVGREHVLGAR